MNKEHLKGVKQVVCYNKKGDIYRTKYYDESGNKIKDVYNLHRFLDATYTYDEDGTVRKFNTDIVSDSGYIKTTRVLDNGETEICKTKHSGELISLKIIDEYGNTLRNENSKYVTIYKVDKLSRNNSIILEEIGYSKNNQSNPHTYLCIWKYIYEYKYYLDNIIEKCKYNISKDGSKILEFFESYSYDKCNNILIEKSNNFGYNTFYDYDKTGKLLTKIARKKGDVITSNRDYSYNEHGSLISIRDNKSGYYETYSYDDNNQLIYHIKNGKLTKYIR